MGVLQLFDWQEFLYLWGINKLDWIVWSAAFLFTIFLVRPRVLVHGACLLGVCALCPERQQPPPRSADARPCPCPSLGPRAQGVEVGIGVSVGLSLLLVIYKSAFPRISTLGRLPGTDIYRSERMYPNAEHQAGLLLLRIDAPIYFANVEVRERLLARPAGSPSPSPVMPAEPARLCGGRGGAVARRGRQERRARQVCDPGPGARERRGRHRHPLSG